MNESICLELPGFVLTVLKIIDLVLLGAGPWGWVSGTGCIGIVGAVSCPANGGFELDPVVGGFFFFVSDGPAPGGAVGAFCAAGGLELDPRRGFVFGGDVAIDDFLSLRIGWPAGGFVLDPAEGFFGDGFFGDGFFGGDFCTFPVNVLIAGPALLYGV
jgi:hypothetical protein